MLRQSLLEVDNLAPLSLHRLGHSSPRGARYIGNQRASLTNQGRALVALCVLEGREGQIEQLLTGLKLIERIRLLLRHHNHPPKTPKTNEKRLPRAPAPHQTPPVAACETNTVGQRFSSSTRLKAGGYGAIPLWE